MWMTAFGLEGLMEHDGVGLRWSPSAWAQNDQPNVRPHAPEEGSMKGATLDSR